MEEPALVEFLRHDPIRGGRWYTHRDGDPVHEYVSRGHVWRQHTPMSQKCVFCGGVFQKVDDPTWAKCPDRPATGTPAWPTPKNSQFPYQPPPIPQVPVLDEKPLFTLENFEGFVRLRRLSGTVLAVSARTTATPVPDLLVQVQPAADDMWSVEVGDKDGLLLAFTGELDTGVLTPLGSNGEDLT